MIIHLNDFSYPLITRGIPFEFKYNLYKNRMSNYGGILRINFLNFKVDYKIHSIKIESNGNMKDISGFYKINIINKDGYTSLEIYYDNIFSIFEEIFKFLNNNYETNNYLHICMNTSLMCNLRCEYCSMAIQKYKNYNKTNKFLAQNYIIHLLCFLKKFNYDNGLRIMGGEPLYDLNDLEETYSFLSSINEDIKILYIYTNLTINLDKYIDFIKKIDIPIVTVVSTDSLNYSKTRRYQSLKQIDSFKENVKKICSNNIKNHEVVYSEVFIDLDSSIDNILFFKSCGVNKYQILIDENELNDDSIELRHTVLNFISNYLKTNNIDMVRWKRNYGNDLVVSFSIQDEYDNDIFKIRKHFDLKFLTNLTLDF